MGAKLLALIAVADLVRDRHPCRFGINSSSLPAPFISFTHMSGYKVVVKLYRMLIMELENIEKF